MTLQEWDRRIAPRLQTAEAAGGFLVYYAKKMQLAVDGLPSRPVWETLAHEKMLEAERELHLALAAVERALEVYENKPVILESV